MRNFRAWYQIPNKRGKFPSLRGHIAGTDISVGLRLNKDGTLRIEPERERDNEYIKTEIDRGSLNPFLCTIEMEPPQREMSRFLCKMALETVAETFFAQTGCTDTIVECDFYDRIRNYARYGNNYPDWPYSQRRIFPEETLMRHPDTNEWVQVGFGCGWFMNKRRETLFAFGFYGTEFVINVGGPSIQGYEEWLEDHGNISPIVERLGCYLVTEGEGILQSYYLHGESNAKKGIEFDIANGYFP